MSRPSPPPEIEARKSVARTFFDATTAAARGAFLKRQGGGSTNGPSARDGATHAR
jgi:hypothetical protein